MLRENTIQRRLVKIVLLIGGAVLLFAGTIILTSEFLTFRQTTIQQASILGQIIAANSTASLAFDDPKIAGEILSALKAERSIVGAGLYNKEGKLLSHYPPDLPAAGVPAAPQADGYRFVNSTLVGFQTITQNEKRLGTLYFKWDLKAVYQRFLFYGAVIIVMMTACLLGAAYLLSRTLRRRVSEPILELAKTARAVSDRQDYSVRARKMGEDELGLLTDVFNNMLRRIQDQNTAVKDSEQRVRAVLNSAMSGVIVIDASGKIIEWNPRAETMFGWQSSDVMGRELAETIIPVRFRDAHRRGMKRFLATREGVVLNRVIELTALRHDGSEFPVELSIGAMETGTETAFCGFVTDITERKRAETRLQTHLSRMELLERITRATAERQDLRSIFQVVIVSLEENLPLDFGCICLYDSTAAMLTVASIGDRSEALATKLAMTDGTRIHIDDGLTICVRGQLVYEPDIVNSPFPFPKRLVAAGLRSFVAAPLPVEDKVLGVLIAARYAPDSFSSPDCEFIRHLSEHVALSAHQADLYGDLQAAYNDLRETQQSVMQQERLRALGQMASGIAHDINNAISPIALYTESLLEKEPNLSERARSYLEITQHAIEDVAQTISRMREFYRQREPQLTLAPVNLNRLVSQVKDLTNAKWGDMPQQRGIVIEMATELTPDLPAIMGVENEIREALVNLVFNAVDAMPEGGTLTIRTLVAAEQNRANQFEAAQLVHLEVSDTGTGMDDETKRRCLEPFFTTKGERGTGLGLPMVYGIAQRHNASVEIESAPGQGTTIRLIFAVSASQATAHIRRSPSASPGTLSILIIDDDPLLIKALRETLESDGHIVTAAIGGQAGIDAFATAHKTHETFSVVITDLGMPYVDGRKVSAAIKALSPKTPVILFTGWGQRLVAEQDIPEHVDRVLNKPPKLHELRAALLELTATTSGSPR